MIARSLVTVTDPFCVARFPGIWLIASLALGCAFDPPKASGNGDAGEVGDAGPGGDGPDPSVFPYLPSNFDPALLPAPADPIVLDCGVSELDSENLGLLNWCGQPEPVIQVLDQGAGLPQLAILAMNGLTVETGSTLRIRGDKSVILAALGPVTVNGTVDASADADVDGSGVMVCPGDRDGTTENDTGGGGGGGGFGQVGAVGAVGEDGGNGGAGGAALGEADLEPLHGGCRGGAGSGVTGGGSGGSGGGGGGAIQISTTTTLEVSAGGIIASGGGGGRPGGLHDGGGGGGSGGAVLLEGATIVLASGAALTANGGGGGEAGSLSNPMLEDPGEPGSLDSVAPAEGGSVSPSAGNGGNGGVQGTAPTQGVTSPNQQGTNGGGGGGGGGGVGRVRVNASTSCAIAGGSIRSPTPTSNGTSGCP